MRKLIVTGSLYLALTASAIAAERRPYAVDEYFGPDDGVAVSENRAALDLAKKWQGAGFRGGNVSVGPDGMVRFLFGAGQPTVVCAVLQLCDIELQVGETVNDVKSGDTVRWIIEPAFTGVAGAEVTHVTVKPTEPGLDTTLSVFTSRRTYNIRLKSTQKDFLPRVGFVYPEDAAAKWQAVRRQADADRVNNTIPETGDYLGNLDFDYRLSGSAPWMPMRVYNDGKKTIIQMPKEMGQTEAPVLLVVRKPGDLWSDEETVLVNYRLLNDRFIVDSLFDRAVLVAGVGSSQDRVTIERRGK